MEEGINQMTQIYDLVVELLVTYSFQIAGAAVMLIIGLMIGRKVSEAIFGLCQKRKLDVTLSKFFASCTRVLIIAATIMVVLPMLDIQITPFVAAIGAVGLGAGLAVQGLLSNYSAGLSIILTRPYIVGDTIKVQGVAGVVQEVKLASTLLSNEDNEIITIPNRHIVGEIIHNSQADSVLELSVGIAYDADPKLAVKVITASLEGIEGISGCRPPQVGIEQFGDSSIDIAVRVWVLTEKLFETQYRCNMAIFDALLKAGIPIPFPQREVRMLGDQAAPPSEAAA